MEKETLIMVFSLSVFFTIVSILVGVSIVSSDVLGDGNNKTTYTKVYVWNTEPNITSISISPATIDLVPGNITQVNCTAYVWDYNGWDDVNVINTTIYHSSVNSDSPDDNNNHYTANISSDCNCTQTASDNASCRCSFDIWYYAYNGTWTCNMSIQDQGGNATERYFYFNDSDTATSTVNTIVGIDVPVEIDYGNLSVTEISTEKLANVTNFGNANISIYVRGYGGTEVNDSANPNNISLICDYNNITLPYERYSLGNGSAFSSMSNITNTSTFTGLNLSIRTNDTQYVLGEDVNTTFWRLEIPLTVGGNCNGTIEFTAQIQ